jgi:hypothetical protein
MRKAAEHKGQTACLSCRERPPAKKGLTDSKVQELGEPSALLAPEWGEPSRGSKEPGATANDKIGCENTHDA